MSYLNHQYSLDYSVQQPQDSTQTEVEFLKLKLLETHSKFIKELQYSRDLEQQVTQLKKQQQSEVKQNEELRKKLTTQTSHNKHNQQQERTALEKARHFEHLSADYQKQNDLLRKDIEIIKDKTKEILAQNERLERDNNDLQRAHAIALQKINAITKENRLKESAIENSRQEAEKYKSQSEKQAARSREFERDLQNLKIQFEDAAKRNEELETALRMDREKQSRQLQEFHLVQKEAKEWKHRTETASSQVNKLRDEIFQIRSRTSAEERSLNNEIEKLTQNHSHLQTQLKQKQHELSSARKQVEEIPRKKNTLEETRQFINKLEKQEQRQLVNRSPVRDISPSRPSRTFREEKEEFLNIIENVGTMENEMLSCKVEKKRIVGEIDRIDQAKVKTKDMISRRRKLEGDLANQEKKIDRIKSQLKRMKVM